MILQETFTLPNGVKIPKLGLGTWLIEDSKVAEPVRAAIEMGYRHIDTAQGYGNERGVGEGVRTSGVPREEIFVTTKLSANIKNYAEAVAAIEESLQKLDLGYIDLMIIHSPQPWLDYHEDNRFFEGNLEAWSALEEAYTAGKLRSIGVSNFEQVDLENILAHGTIKPMVNQILAHISNTPFELIAYNQSEGILIQAYSPVAHGELLKNEEVSAMAERYGVSIPQLCIRYCLQLDMLPLPKTANPAHIRANAEIDFEISEVDMEVLKNIRRIKNYGDASLFPVYGGKLTPDGVLHPRDYFVE
ncbi:aldo/keto reductase [Emticicia sp. C21]|uniref:aldo/keto reductase n=1 Tax=Emticicia sp. C21 TaxID=2302915 RepID=UPI000E34852E|nr:aldo/keto reductase [Emticicia sp. C21]RFS16931.1 aldo/keto reductase [Emticicia sp. C21]